MFQGARIKLTAWYLAIIMTISLSFSAVIYFGVSRELTRIESLQRTRIQRIVGTLPLPFEISTPDVDAIAEARVRLLSVLGLVNLSIFVLAGAGGYFLAGRTLEPISKMVEDQKAFVSDASHELRTPLTSLKTEIEVALRDRAPNIAKLKSLLKSNLEDVNRMQILSNYLLKLNRYEVGRVLPRTKVDLKEVVIAAVGKKKVKTDLEKSIVTGNKDALIELVTILVDNAVKFGLGKSIEVRTKAGGILEVEDHGVGITGEDLPHVFDRFYRSDKSRGTEGYGLGLSIAKSIVDAHEGTIKIKSKVGKGTVFRVDLS